MTTFITNNLQINGFEILKENCTSNNNISVSDNTTIEGSININNDSIIKGYFEGFDDIIVGGSISGTQNGLFSNVNCASNALMTGTVTVPGTISVNNFSTNSIKVSNNFQSPGNLLLLNTITGLYIRINGDLNINEITTSTVNKIIINNNNVTTDRVLLGAPASLENFLINGNIEVSTLTPSGLAIITGDLTINGDMRMPFNNLTCNVLNYTTLDPVYTPDVPTELITTIAFDNGLITPDSVDITITKIGRLVNFTFGELIQASTPSGHIIQSTTPLANNYRPSHDISMQSLIVSTNSIIQEVPGIITIKADGFIELEVNSVGNWSVNAQVFSSSVSYIAAV